MSERVNVCRVFIWNWSSVFIVKKFLLGAHRFKEAKT